MDGTRILPKTCLPSPVAETPSPPPPLPPPTSGPGLASAFDAMRAATSVLPQAAHCDAKSDARRRNFSGSPSTFTHSWEVVSPVQEKVYVFDTEPQLLAAFDSRALLRTIIKGFVLGFHRPVTLWFKQVEETLEREEESGEREPLPEFHLVPPLRSSVLMCARDVVVRSLKEAMQLLASAVFPGKIAAKLLKDVRRSAMRKAARVPDLPAWRRAAWVARTASRAHMVAILSDTIVSQAINLYKYYASVNGRQDARGRPKKKDGEVVHAIIAFRNETYMNVARHLIALAFASAGAGVGSCVHVNHGSWIGMVLGDALGNVVARGLEGTTLKLASYGLDDHLERSD